MVTWTTCGSKIYVIVVWFVGMRIGIELHTIVARTNSYGSNSYEHGHGVWVLDKTMRDTKALWEVKKRQIKELLFSLLLSVNMSKCIICYVVLVAVIIISKLFWSHLIGLDQMLSQMGSACYRFIFNQRCSEHSDY